MQYWSQYRRIDDCVDLIESFLPNIFSFESEFSMLLGELRLPDWSKTNQIEVYDLSVQHEGKAISLSSRYV